MARDGQVATGGATSRARARRGSEAFSRVGARLRPWLLGLVFLAACHPPAPPPPAPDDEYPRCLGSDADGNKVVCAAPPRSYHGDRCSCVGRDRRIIYYGRVQEHPVP